MSDILFLGHSHTLCVYNGMIQKGYSVDWENIVGEPGFGPVILENGKYWLDPNLAARIYELLKSNPICISTIAGNAHNVLGMMKSPKPFDFYSQDINAPVDKNVSLLTYRAVYDALSDNLNRFDLTMLTATAATAPRIRWHIGSPPPLRDNAQIVSKIDGFFLEKYPGVEVADPWFRLKLWALHTRLYREACIQMGIEFIEPPKEATDQDGFLLPEFSDSRSATHANDDYGLLVVEQIEARL